jgi:hypothetical protein
MLAQILPGPFSDIDAVVPRSLLDVGERLRALGVGDALDLVEARDCVADVARIGERFLALFGKRIDAIRQIALLREPAAFFVRLPSGLHASIIPQILASKHGYKQSCSLKGAVMESPKQWREFVGSTEESVSEAIERAKDAASEAAESRTGRAARHVADRVERAVSSRPENAMWRTLWLTLAGAATLGSIGMYAARRKHESLYVGQFVPVLMMLALWGQLVRD